MDFRLTQEQVDLQDAIRAFCTARYPVTDLAALEAAPLGDAWARLADMDVFRIAAPSTSGGLGLGIVEAAVVYEVLGNHLVPGPLVWSALAKIHLPELTAGTAIVGGLDGDLRRDEPVLIDYAGDLDALVVLRHDGVHLVDSDELDSCEAVTPIDPLTPVSRATSVPGGRRVADHLVAGDMREIGAVLTSALLVGMADRALDAAVSYANQRNQFGRPIASFQAIKHLLADMYVRAALARSATYGAAAMADDREIGDLATAAATAKLLAADAAIRNAKTCIQVHGGMGFTWEMIPHYLLKRAWVLEHSFGSRAHHAETVARELANEVAP